MGDLIHDWGHGPLLDRRADPFPRAMTLRQLRLKNSKPSETASSPQAHSLDRNALGAPANARQRSRLLDRLCYSAAAATSDLGRAPTFSDTAYGSAELVEERVSYIETVEDTFST